MSQSATLASRKTLAELRKMLDAKQGDLTDAQYARYQTIILDAIEIHESRTRHLYAV